MAELIAKTPCDGVLPLSAGTVTASEEDLGVLTSLASFKGADLSAALKDAHGMAAPAPNRATGKSGSRAIWFGREQVLLAGPSPDAALAQHAALTDQSDAWAIIRVDGDAARDVLARLVPVDLRPAHFKRGHTARTLIMHMNGSVTRVGENTYILMVFRSMAATLVHDLKSAMEAVAARG